MFTAKPSSSLSSCCELKTTSKTSGMASFCGSFFPSGSLASFHLDCETFFIFIFFHFFVMFCYCMVLQMQKLMPSMLRVQKQQRFSLFKPGVSLTVDLHASCTDRNCSFQMSAFLAHLFYFFPTLHEPKLIGHDSVFWLWFNWLVWLTGLMLSPKRCWWGLRSQEVGEEGDYT